MPEAYAQVAPDQGGKKIRTRERTIGANTIEEQYVIPLDSDRVLSGRFFAHSGALLVQATADAALGGRFFLLNPLASTILVAVRRMEFQSQHGSALTTTNSPRIVLKTFSYTSGSATGTVIAAQAHDTVNDAAQQAKLVTATTGLGGMLDGVVVKSFLPTVALTAVGIGAASEEDWILDPAYPLILRPGQGLYCTQPDAGTTSDTRRFVLDMTFDEYTQP